MRRPALSLAVLGCVLLGARDARPAGLLLPRNGEPPLQMQSHRVVAVVEDGLARTTVRQTFVNPHARALEAVYVFPIPDQAALVDLALEMGGARLEGLLAERKTARRAYDAITARGRDPALVEQIGRSLFRLSVFPVLPDAPTVVELTWIETVPLRHGEYRYVYPLTYGQDATAVEEDLTVGVTVRSSAAIQSITSADPDVLVRRVSDHEARASLERSAARLERDVVIVARVAETEPRLAVHVLRAAGAESAYFAAVLTPPPLAVEEVLPRDVTLALDVSGSMAEGGGHKIQQARAAARWLIERMRPQDRVNVILFNDMLERFAAAPVPVTVETRTALLAFVESAPAQGGTALGDAVQAACAAPAEAGRVSLAVILTDGMPSVGEARTERLLAAARQGAERGLRTFTFGVGGDANAALLDGVATAGSGAAEVFRPAAEIETRLVAFLTRTASPAMAELQVTLDGRPVDDVVPRPLPVVYLGEQAVIAGRVRADGERELVVTARFRGEQSTFRQVVDLGTATAPRGNSTVARDLYARGRLAFLQQSLRLREGLDDTSFYAVLDRGGYSTTDELVAAQIEVSLETGVQCPYTSFLALLPDDRRRLDPRDAAALEAAVERARERRRVLAGPDADRGGDGSATDEVAIAPGTAAADLVTDGEQVVDAREEVEQEWVSDERPTPHYSVIGVGGGAGGRFGGKYGGRGGGRAARATVPRMLEWLQARQRADGAWSCTGTGGICDPHTCSASGVAGPDVETTGLALLAYLGAGNSVNAGTGKDVVRAGVRWLLEVQDPETGCFGDASRPGFRHDHVLATLAMTEAYGLSRWPILKEPAQKGITLLLALQEQDGGWHLDAPRPGIDDLVLTGFAVLALQSARDFGLEVADEAVARARGRLAAVGAGAPARDVAIAVLGEILLAPDAADVPALRARIAPVALAPAPGSGTRDPLHVFFMTCAVHQLGGHVWRAWQLTLNDVVAVLPAADPAARWGAGKAGHGAGIRAAALLALTSAASSRYDRVIGLR